MKKEYKINLFKDKKDYRKVLTSDNVINVIGTKGSGKTTLTLKYMSDKDYVIVSSDKLFEIGDLTVDDDKVLKDIKDMLVSKYSALKDSEFSIYYNDIVEYVLSKNKKLLIEGNALLGIDINNLKGEVIVKRTAIFKAFIRVIKRDYHNKYFMDKEKELHGNLAKVTRLYKVIKRRKKIFKEYKEIEEKIKELELK